MIGDTDSTDPQLDDAEVNWSISETSSARSAAIMCVENLIAKYSRLVDKTVGPFSESLSQRLDGYKTLLSRLRATLASGASIYAGGISISTKQTRQADTDRVKPAFYVGMMNNPNNGESASSS